MQAAAFLPIYNHIINRLDRLSEKGWRRALGWSGFIVAMFSFVYAPLHQIAVDYTAVNVYLGLVVTTFVSRGVEQVARDRAAGGGLVNNVALS
jgi:hypothetical protein